ncbi:solute carrier organic anion transporter family member 74D-like [Stegodyphus dumicola]|uniref:solute carrier organic anion transporter family member 74D-like n=1 Tax=Stegodyphus dumicola TaxID=202533 RepID=UPI0015AF5744|nr:solute carrier organic anion transporter family member 74D-like [Stegodyphus dumicola]XP_035208491.1 solute carrier organic anion transporter family member 74D-like [Stegodyphus dumicola]XP_035208492.1 solute carrier organic anion transporter family member 74D-like [Stegodyphus dumicola]
MERWKTPQGTICKTCLNPFDERSAFPTCCTMITPNGHGTPLKNPQNLTAGCNGNILIKNGNSKSHITKPHINNGHIKNGHHLEKNGHHLDLVKDSLCCLKQSQSSLKKQSIDNSDDKDDSCGLWSLKPRWLQPFANKKVFLAVFCLTSVLQGMYYTYFVSVLTTIEKLYQIQSKTTGLIMSATEVGQIGGALLLTYYGGQGHRPKWIACGMLVFAAASIFCATPHFLYSDLTSSDRSTSDTENSSTVALRELRTKLCHNKLISKSESARYIIPLASSNSSSDGIYIGSFGNYTYDLGIKSSMHNRSSRSAYTDDFRLSSDTNGTSSAISLPSKEALIMKRDECEERSQSGTHTRTTHTVLVIFFASLLLIGIGATAVYTLGIPYIDDNVATRESPLYFGITIGVRIFGPVFGFLLGSFCTSIYVNFPFETTEITTDNPQWLGAWWLGVLIVGAALILTSFPMMAFPKKLPKPCLHGHGHVKTVNRNIRTGDIPKSNDNANGLLQDNHCHLCQQSAFYNTHNEDLKKPSLKDFPSAIRRLLKNEILLYRTASSVLHILPIAGLYTFLPKYLESQFQLTATMANMISGIAGILVMGVGIFASGTFMRKFKPNARFVARWIALSALLYAVGMMILMIFGCPLNSYVGLNVGSEYEDTSQLTCNETCGCKPGEFAPICTSEGVTYLSPCLAGCTEVSGSSYDEYIYKDCLCLGANVTATNGFCPLQCDSLLPYVFVFALFVLIHSTSEVGSMLLTLRCVEPKDKAMALGLIAFAIGLFGNVPCPIIYGAVVDSACLFWEDNCGEPGACRLYDPSKFRAVFHGVTAVIMLMAFFVDIIVWYKAKSIQFQDEDIIEDAEEAVPFNETQFNTQLESSV